VTTVTCNDVECDPNATCSGTGKAAKCACLSGYQGDGTTCTDVDECATGKADCDKNATCTNRPGSFACKCNSGYIADGKSCTAVSKCGSDTDVCDPNATCGTDKSGVTCTCNTGFTGDGMSCGDVDECATKAFSCATNAHCVNDFGGYDCSCDAGFTGDGNKACSSLCDAAKTNTAVCDPKGICRVDGSAATCDACAPGSTGDGKTCMTATCGAQCDGASTDDAAHAICKSDGSCACAPGYTGSPGSCKDVDECATDNGKCPSNTKCANTDGGHTCACSPGYAPDKTGACVDVDECKATPSPCHPDATCKNTTPDAKGVGYTCTCNAGFTGDGTTCTDIDECAKNNGGCDANATCINKRGSSSCECTGGLVGDAKTGCYCDLSGIWAIRQEVDTCWKATPIQTGLAQNLISAGNVQANVWSISEMVYDGTSVKTRGKGCNGDRTPDLLSPYFLETYSSYVPDMSFDAVDLQAGATWKVPGLLPGAKFTTPSDAAVIGIDLGSDPLNAKWPATHNDVTKWVDLDGDGEPGWSLWPRVPSQTTLSGTGKYSYLPVKPATGSGGTYYVDGRAGCISVAVRVITHLQGKVDDCTHLSGTVINEKTEGRVHSCTRVDKGTCSDPLNKTCTGWNKDITCTADDWKNQPACDPGDIDRLDNDQNQVQNSTAAFEMVKIGEVGDKVGCSDVKDKLPAVARTMPITCTTPQ
jgi:hypothetical protein